MAMRFCTREEYIARYGEPDDPAQLEECLAEASREIERAVRDAGRGDMLADPDFLLDCKAVCRDMVFRVASNSVPFGATQYSQSAAGFSESYSFARAYGSIKINRADREKLGIARKHAAGCIKVAIHDASGAEVEW